MTETARERLDRQERESTQLATFFRSKPEPLATRDEVLSVPCPYCSAQPGQPCDTTFPRMSILGLAMPALSGIHTRRYLDKTSDPR